MNDENRKPYFEGLCNRLHDSFIHFSTVRVVVLSFCIPLGGLLIVEAWDYRWAGIWVIFIAWVLNFYFGSQSQSQWLHYRNTDLWLKIGYTTQSFEPDYEMDVPGYSELMLCRLPKKEELKDAKVVEGRDWREDWISILKKTKKNEWVIQTSIFVGLVVLLLMLHDAICPVWIKEAAHWLKELGWGVAMLSAFAGMTIAIVGSAWWVHCRVVFLKRQKEEARIRKKLCVRFWLLCLSLSFFALTMLILVLVLNG